MAVKTNLVVSGIDENLVDNLEETRDIFDLLVYHTLCIRVKCPHNLCDGLYAADIRVRSLEDMFNLRKLRDTVNSGPNVNVHATNLGISLRCSFLLPSRFFALNRRTLFVVRAIDVHDAVVCILIDIRENFLLACCFPLYSWSRGRFRLRCGRLCRYFDLLSLI